MAARDASPGANSSPAAGSAECQRERQCQRNGDSHPMLPPFLPTDIKGPCGRARQEWRPPRHSARPAQAECPVQHPGRYKGQEQAERGRQPATVERVREPGAERGDRPGHGRDDREAGQAHVSDRERQSGRVGGWRQQVAQRRRHADPQSRQCGRADRLVYRLAAQRHGGHAQRSSTDAHHRGQRADRRRDRGPTDAARDRATQHQVIERQQHLEGSCQRDAAEDRRENSRVHARREQRARQRSQHDRQRPALHQRVVHRAPPGVRARRGERRGDDRGHRGRHRDVQRRAGWHAREFEGGVEHRDDHDAAADAEQARQQATQGARGRDRGDGRQPDQPLVGHCTTLPPFITHSGASSTRTSSSGLPLTATRSA